jgi:glycosidase
MKSAFRILILFSATAMCFAQTAWWVPAAPRIGDQITIYYDANIGSLNPDGAVWMHWGVYDIGSGDWSAPPNEIWPEGSILHSDNVALQSPLINDGEGLFSVTIDMDDVTEAIAFVFTDRGDNWDNNGGNDWLLEFEAAGLVSWWSPDEPEPGDVITIYYDVLPGSLPNDASSVILHWGVNEAGHGNWSLPPEEIWPEGTVAQGQAARTPMNSLGGGLFNIVIDTNDDIISLHYVTTDGTNWDNNGDQNWDIFLDEPPPVTGTHVVFRFDPRSAFSQFVGTVNTLNLAGTFNGWSMSGTPLTSVDPYGNFYGEVEIPTGELQYKFVVNGNNWQIDYDNPRNISEFNNSLLTVVLDSFPQFYDISPFENTVFDVGENVIVSMNLRPGDLGPGLEGDPVVIVDEQPWPHTYDQATGLLTLSSLPSNEGRRRIIIGVVDSLGRVGQRELAIGFVDDGFFAVDPFDDLVYPAEEFDHETDLLAFSVNELSDGDSILLSIDFFTLDFDNSVLLLTISAQTDNYGPVDGLLNEFHVPGLSAGGVAMLIVDFLNPNIDPAIHNVLHPNGSLANIGEDVMVEYDYSNNRVNIRVSKEDLESYLGSYQSAWYYTCSSMVPGGESFGWSHEVTAADGGSDDIEDPDIWDTMFMMAADLETKMFKNYGLVRRVTMDAPGRGVAAITPEQIGPNIRTPGPVSEVLTRGAPTTTADQAIVGQVTSDIGITSAWLTHNETVIPVTLNADTFLVNVTLDEGANIFNVLAVDANADTGRSPSMLYTYVIDRTPQVSIEARVQGNNGFLDASETFDPFDVTMHFFWSADPDNPEETPLGNWQTPIADLELPTTPGEYYFDLTVSNDDGYESHGRTFIRKFESAGAAPFENDQSADWVMNAIMYEIFVRTHSPTGDLDGVTADIPRLADLGVSVIWLMPIFEGPSSHGYEITDYYTVEQDYGTAEDLHELVEACHSHGIKLILDMVINHSGIGHPFMQDALRYGHYSHYYDWYDRDAQGNYTYYFDWQSLPNINHNNPECAQYWIDMCKYWVSEFDIDGYRCDVAWGPQQRTPQFWVDWRQQLKEIKPEVMLFAEAGANDFGILTDRFDLAKDWNLHHEGPAAFTNLFPSIPDFNNLTDLITNYGFPWPAFKGPVRFLENHDEARYISIKTPQQTKLVASLLMSIPGIPQIYHGQEIGFPAQREMIPWGTDPENLYPFYYRLIKGRSLLPAMRTGDFTLIENSQSGACYSYARTLNGEFPVVFTGNFSTTSQVVSTTLDPDLLDIEADSTYIVTDLTTGNTITRVGSELGSIFTSLSPHQSRLWVIADSALVLVETDDAPRPELPDRIALYPAYPNPFNPSTTIPFEIDRARHVKLSIYDVLGREVATLIDGVIDAGMHRIQWEGRASGNPVASGLYFTVLRSESDFFVHKLILLK